MNDYFHYVPDVDYFLYDPKTSTSTTSTTDRLRPQRRLLRLLPPRPEDTGVEPEDPLSHVCTQTLNPLYLYALFSITYQLYLKCHRIMLHRICWVVGN